MRVTGNVGLRASPYAAPKSRRTANGPGWEKYLDVEIQKRKMAALPEKGSLGSVYMQFQEDYNAWRAQQPEPDLPEAQGWTEENLAFLRERYSGDLSAFEAYDALETMRRMGAISQKEMNYASGTHMIAFDAKDLGGFITSEVDPNSKEAWLGGFDKAPMVDFHSLADILSWVENFRAREYPDAIPYAEAAAQGLI